MIYLLRHGDAEEGDGDDDARRLTAEGRAPGPGRRRSACRARGRDRGLPDVTQGAGRATPRGSPAEALGVEVETTEALRGGPFDAAELAAGRGEVLLVGHEPDFSDEIGRLTGAQLKLKKGGLALVDGGVLKALLRPADLAAIAAGPG